MTEPNERIESKAERDLSNYIKDRLEYKINNYVRMAHGYRNLHWAMASVGSVGAALVPALINLVDDPVAPTVVSLVVAITVALDRVFLPREHWRNYELVSALLREEEMMFSTRSGPYARCRIEGEEELFAKLVERVEDAVHREREETIVMRTTQNGGIEGQTQAT